MCLHACLAALILGSSLSGSALAQNSELTPSPADPNVAVRSEAIYDITFQGAWTTAVTPAGLPGGAHFSRLIGGVHNDRVVFLQSGQMASAGVENMAEVGGYSTLGSEIDNAGANRRSVLQGTTDFVGPTATATFSNVTLTTDHPRVTLTTMIAPSPDWFVGVSGQSLLTSAGEWRDSLSVDLYPWDAGTENGTDFSLSNSATSPRQNIASIRNTGKFSNQRIATLTFTRQSRAPAAPTPTVHAGDGGVALTWSAPGGAAGITNYDLRIIQTTADETVDVNWTVHQDVLTTDFLGVRVTALTNGTSYDFQVRAVAGSTDGAWSTTVTATPADPGDDTSTAADVPLDLGLPGELTQNTDPVDYYKFTLPRRTGVLIFTTSDLETGGGLYDSNGDWIDDVHHILLGGDFALATTLAAGTYYVKVEAVAFDGNSGAYVVRVNTIPETTNRSNATSVGVDDFENGLIDPGGDVDWYTFTLTAETDVLLRTGAPLSNTVGELLNSNGASIESNDDGFLLGRPGHFLIRRKLPAGTYYVKVRASSSKATGLYSFHVDTVTEPGSSTASAQPLEFGDIGAGRIDPPSDTDYFRMNMADAGHVLLYAVSNSVDIDGAMVRANGAAIPADIFELRFAASGPRGFVVSARLPAGASYLKITRSAGASTGGYALRALRDTPLDNVFNFCQVTPSPWSDPFGDCLWHLRNRNQLGGTSGEDLKVEPVWAGGNLGAGVGVAIVDGGVHGGHPDLVDNFNEARSHDYHGGGLFEPLTGSVSSHGTAVAGVVAARDNAIGVRGVAPRATIFSYNLLAVSILSNEADAMTRNLATTAVSNNSWGFVDSPAPNVAASAWEVAIDTGVTSGYGGKGISYVWAGGNGNALDDDYSTLDGRANYYGVMAVCATTDEGRHAFYSELGANLWVCGPSDGGQAQITTLQNLGRYTRSFGGTSAAAPAVSGVVALMRAANPNLTWRDVKLILAASARKNDPSDSGWRTGARKYGASGNYNFNHKYGHGTVDANAAVTLAKSWTNLPTFVSTIPARTAANLSVPDGPSGATVTSTVAVGSDVDFIEHVEIMVDFVAPAFRDLHAELVSPSGTVSVLTVSSTFVELGGGRIGIDRNFRFGSAAHLGENPAGTWTLRIKDEVSGGAVARLNSWSVKIYGHRATVVNRAPVPVGTLSARDLRVGDGNETVEVASAFSDPDNDSLTYAVSSSAPAVARATISGSRVTLTPVARGTARIRVTATDVSGSNTSATQQFDAQVKGRRGVTVSTAALSVDEGSTNTWTVMLDSEPTGDVTVTPSVPANSNLSVRPVALTFTTGNWQTPQTVTVEALTDANTTSEPAVTVSHQVTGADYGSVTAPSVDVTIVEQDASVLSVDPVSGPEGAGALIFRVTLSRPSTSRVLVDYATSDGTASAGSDYTASSGTLTFPANQAASRQISVFVTDDGADEEEEETFRLTLSNPRHATLVGGGATLQVLGTIQDDDVPDIVVSFGAASYPVTEGGTTNVAVRLDRDAERNLAIPLRRAHQGGATPADYSGVPASVTFGPGVSSRQFLVSATDDTANDDGESVVLSFGSLPARVTGGGSTTIAINDNDDGGGGGGTNPPPPPPPNPGGGGGGGSPPQPPPPPPPNPGGGGGGSPPQPPPPPPPNPGGGGGSPPQPPPAPSGPPRAAIDTGAECAEGLCRVVTGAPVSFQDVSTGVVRTRSWDFGDGRRSRSSRLNHSWTAPGFYEVTLTASDGTVESTATLTFLVEAASTAGTCVADERTRCLRSSRYAVAVDWRNASGSGAAAVVRSGTDDSGVFQFFGPTNWEVLVKVLDGCEANGHFWVFAASTTDLGYEIAVTDTVTAEVRTYRNEPGQPAPAITDVTAFPNACTP